MPAGVTQSPERIAQASGRDSRPAAPAVNGNVDPIVRLGRALADPVRVRMLMLVASGRQCCSDLRTNAPAGTGKDGLCVCELAEHFGLGQSRVSYHVKRLKDAGLLKESRRGKWSFYSLDRDALWQLLRHIEDTLQVGTGGPKQPPRIVGNGGERACCGVKS
ncbi:MAG: winged helix-turn-helix transcriptional regulator [Firmicutes bacterium]|nr:winged helix-turn-helix transcriptional regulator [Bacillota bacterium]